MTTKLELKNAATSNGDAHIDIVCGGSLQNITLHPGEKNEAWISTSSKVLVTETWPTEKPAQMHLAHGEAADALIDGEIAKQDAMWGVANERADSSKGQLMRAALAQLDALYEDQVGGSSLDRSAAFKMAEHAYYPSDWSGFRDYGSDIANLVVAAAYIRQEIKRRIAMGESTYRAPRPESQPYTGVDQPAMSSAEAAG